MKYMIYHCWRLVSQPYHGLMFEARNVYECIHCGKTTDNMLSVGYCKEIEYEDGVVNVNNNPVVNVIDTPVVNMIDCPEVNIRHDTHIIR